MKNYRNTARVVLANGYSPLPLKPRSKQPARANWQHSKCTESDFASNHGVGVLTGDIVGIDIDISHPVIGPAMIAWCLEHLGSAPERVGAAPRVMLVYRAEVAGSKRNSASFFDPTDATKPSGKRNDQQIEVLGQGQQFVAYAVHPDTGKQYKWVDLFGGLEYWPAADLPVVTETQIDALFAEFDRLVNETQGLEVVQSVTNAYCDDDLLNMTTRTGITLAEAVGYLGDVENNFSYDDWVQIGMGLHHEFDGSDEAFDAWEAWGKTSAKYIEGEGHRKWRSFGKGGKVTSIRWLIKLANAVPTLDKVLATVRTKPENWAAMAAQLPRGDAQTVIDEVWRLTGTGKRILSQNLNDAREALKQKNRAELVAQRTGDRVLINHHPEDATKQAAQVDALIIQQSRPGEYVQFGGLLSHIVVKESKHAHRIDNPDAAPPPVLQIQALNQVEILGRVEKVATFQSEKRLIAVPDPIIQILLHESEHAAQSVTGVASHPIVMHDGNIHAVDGLHAASGLFFAGATVSDARTYNQQEGAQALARLRDTLGEGFEFATPLDLDIAVAGLLTGLQRRVLDQSPGLAVIASAQASGKTTLPRRIHVLLTGHDMPATAFNDDSDEATTKRLLAILLNSPAMVCFDNIKDGFTFRSAPIASAMTSATFTDRILGVSKMGEVPTNTLFVITGNNLSLGTDEVTRWLTCRLAPKGANPEKRTFKFPDVVAHALSVRSDALRDAIGIIAGYPGTVASASRFTQWDKMVRQPIIWAGGLDVATVFDVNDAQSEENNAHRGLLLCLREVFEGRSFTARAVVGAATAWPDDQGGRLMTCLENLGVSKVSDARSVGHCLTKKLNRPALIEGVELSLYRNLDRNGISNFQVRG